MECAYYLMCYYSIRIFQSNNCLPDWLWPLRIINTRWWPYLDIVGVNHQRWLKFGRYFGAEFWSRFWGWILINLWYDLKPVTLVRALNPWAHCAFDNILVFRVLYFDQDQDGQISVFWVFLYFEDQDGRISVFWVFLYFDQDQHGHISAFWVFLVFWRPRWTYFVILSYLYFDHDQDGHISVFWVFLYFEDQDGHIA